MRYSRSRQPGEISSSPDRPGKRSIDPVLDNLTHFLDQLFRIPGTNIRFGLDPILGLLFPGGGDALSNLLSGYIIWRSVRYGVPKIVVARMVFNVAVDYVLGAVPVIGDLFDFGFKANQRNLNLIKRHASGQRSPSWSDWAWVLMLLTILAGLIIAGLVAVLVLLRWYGFPLV